MRESGLQAASELPWLPGHPASDVFSKRCQELAVRFDAVFAGLNQAFVRAPKAEDLLWLRDNQQQVMALLTQVESDLAPLTSLPHVSRGDQALPRVLAIAEAFVAPAPSPTTFNEREFAEFCLGFEQTSALEFHEIGALVPALKLTVLEEIATRGQCVVNDPLSPLCKRVTDSIRTLREIAETSWADVIESLIPFDPILRQDPADAYSAMDVESRNVYRENVARIARRSDRSELQVAQEALALAQGAHKRTFADPRTAMRESHIGYYLIGEGARPLCHRVGCHPVFRDRLRQFVRAHPDELLMLGTVVLTLAIVTGAVALLTPATTALALVLLSVLFVLLPASQAAVQVVNYAVTNLLPAHALPKLDLSKGIPADCETMVAIPTLLLNEKQVRGLVEQLEVRYLGNHDPRMHFALVSDLPDSDKPAPENSPLVALCVRLIGELNDRYAAAGQGTFFLLHRHRVYNPREKGWMGWERKRGKLIDLNQLLRGQYDSFPVKVGDLSILPKVRFVITLDSDTELPRGTAHRLVGTMAHPLNQAIIDPHKNIVVAGYGILQPRVGVSVQSSARSRLAAIFAGETGLDPYTRAVSDVYQDLYGEGTFVGKGIYEVDTVSRVLTGRFPRNRLLSHDLIEGAYARAGLVTDIIVIEDYPSHYSAYSKRKHRWLRGDWQIAEWLTDTVPDESGARVPNPISLVSRWKIFDNLRRSLVEPATFALFLFGWLVMGRPLLWTVAAICLLFVPAFVEFVFAVARSMVRRRAADPREALSALFSSNFTVLLTLTLLPHQMLLSIDAVARALVRRLVTRESQLEWETAAEAELGKHRTPVDRYIDWMPPLAVGIGLLAWYLRPRSLWAAAPILILWAASKLVALWLNASPLPPVHKIARKDVLFLRRSALYIWRYFADLSNPEHNWLVPDNIQQNPERKVAASISPTNVGLLLNARQVANEMGYLTLPEMVDLTQKTLTTVAKLEKREGHLLNWYETRTLNAKSPFFISSVDNGNLVASLWTLQQGCLDRLRQPLLSRASADGVLDHLRALVDLDALPKRTLSSCEAQFEKADWLDRLLGLPDEVLNQQNSSPNSRQHSNANSAANSDANSIQDWFRQQTLSRIREARALVRAYLPWKLPEFAAIRSGTAAITSAEGEPSLAQLPDVIARLESHLLKEAPATPDADNRMLSIRLQSMLPQIGENVSRLIADIQSVSHQVRDLAEAMDFGFLLDRKRLQMSVGFNAEAEKLEPYFYDLLATEPRTAVFIAIAKEDIPQECWFRLSRPYANVDGQPALLSWTGTMFEYLMPSVWMRNYPNTLLDRATITAVRIQQTYAANKGVPWGISESACSKINPAGDYHYEAFGVPELALKKSDSNRLVVSPYSTFLALTVDSKKALSNLHRMDALGWFSAYGFCEAADYTGARSRPRSASCEIVQSWMVHHQGMSLLALGNFLCDNVVQRWFHSERRVQATELLLQEKPRSSQ